MNCPNCKTPVGAPDWKARYTVLWSNGYGNKKRIFCDVCGQWSDIKTRYGSSIELTTQEVTIVHEPTHQPR